jgi:hypothetical protein
VGRGWMDEFMDQITTEKKYLRCYPYCLFRRVLSMYVCTMGERLRERGSVEESASTRNEKRTTV